MQAYVDGVLQAQAQGRALAFAVREPGGAIVGCTRFYGLEPEVPKLLIGYTWYARRWINTSTTKKTPNQHMRRTEIRTEKRTNGSANGNPNAKRRGSQATDAPLARSRDSDRR
mgnify:CR=1 FL=1